MKMYQWIVYYSENSKMGNFKMQIEFLIGHDQRFSTLIDRAYATLSKYAFGTCY